MLHNKVVPPKWAPECWEARKTEHVNFTGVRGLPRGRLLSIKTGIKLLEWRLMGRLFTNAHFGSLREIPKTAHCCLSFPQHAALESPANKHSNCHFSLDMLPAQRNKETMTLVVDHQRHHRPSEWQSGAWTTIAPQISEHKRPDLPEM